MHEAQTHQLLGRRPRAAREASAPRRAGEPEPRAVEAPARGGRWDPCATDADCADAFFCDPDEKVCAEPCGDRCPPH